MNGHARLYRKMAYLGTIGALVLVANGPSAAASNSEKVKLSGCLVQADGDGRPYLLTNSPAAPALVTASSGDSALSAVGTSGEFRTVFYWLNGKELQPHVGHRVEIEGEVKGDIRAGEIKLDRKENWTELTVKSDGRTLKARVPNLSVVPDGKNREQKGQIATRLVDVDSVRMLAASCEP